MALPSNLSNDTTECCQQLLKEARAGRLQGLAFIGVIKGRGYIANTAGEAHRSPTWTRGALLALDDKPRSPHLRRPR